MRKTPLIPAIAALLLLLSSCCKDHLPIPGDLSPYQIKTFVLNRSLGESPYYDTLTFSYDHYGNCTSVIRPYPGTGYPNFLFFYDNAHRLIEFIGAYSNPTVAEFAHRYYYNQAGQIAVDSVLTFVSLTNGQPSSWLGSYAHYLKYDHQDRITRDSTTEPGISGTTYYSYDARGNLINGATYDNKVNFRRTNLLWMFLERNYSLNNPFVATKYNAGALPLDFVPDTHGGDSYFIYDNEYVHGWLTYERR